MPWKNIIFGFIELILLINIIFVDVWFAQSLFKQPQGASIQSNVLSPMPTLIVPKITEITQSITPTLTPVPTLIKTQVQNTQTQVALPVIKEYFVPLGIGQSTASDWTDVPGAQSYVDNTSYPSIKQVIFEAAVHTPTGNQTAWIRLFNKTDGHPVWFSEMSWSGGDQQFLSSQPISLDTGSKLYIVQMKTQLQSASILDNAKIYIKIN